jgi:hypothetical protein
VTEATTATVDQSLAALLAEPRTRRRSKPRTPRPEAEAAKLARAQQRQAEKLQRQAERAKRQAERQAERAKAQRRRERKRAWKAFGKVLCALVRAMG